MLGSFAFFGTYFVEMKPLFVATLLLAIAAGSPAWAEDGAGKAPYWSLGGALRSADAAARVVVWDGGSMTAGLAQPDQSPVAGPVLKGMQLGGFLAWQGEDYRFDAILAPAIDRSFVAAFGASAGALPGEAGTSYGVHLGAAWSGERFTVNPQSGFGLAEVTAPSKDLNLTVSVNHALTPSLSVVGTAEARHSMGPPPDGGTVQNRIIFGAGLGYRF